MSFRRFIATLLLATFAALPFAYADTVRVPSYGSVVPGSSILATGTASSTCYLDSTKVFQCNGPLWTNSAGTGTLASPTGINFALLATAPAATTGASQVGKNATLTASAAVASTDTAGAAAGGNVTLTGGAAARFTSGNANGGNVVVVGGAGIGTGTTGTFDFSGALQAVAPAGAVGTPAYSFTGATTSGLWVTGTEVVTSSSGAATLSVRATGTTGIYTSSGNAFGWSSTSASTGSPDAFLTRFAAANIRLGAGDSATPTAQTLGFQGSRGGTDTDIAGTSSTIQSSLGTGQGAGAAVNISRAVMKATGTTQQTAAHAFTACESKTLSNTTGTATALANITLPNNSSGAAYATVSVQCNDGTNFDSDIVTSYVAYVNKAGTLTFGTPVTTGTAAANNSGSCTVAPTWVANGTTSVDFKVTPVITTIAPTATTAAVNIQNFGGVQAGGGGVVACR